jgi:hypothetical protein
LAQRDVPNSAATDAIGANADLPLRGPISSQGRLLGLHQREKADGDPL